MSGAAPTTATAAVAAAEAAAPGAAAAVVHDVSAHHPALVSGADAPFDVAPGDVVLLVDFDGTLAFSARRPAINNSSDIDRPLTRAECGAAMAARCGHGGDLGRVLCHNPRDRVSLPGNIGVRLRHNALASLVTASLLVTARLQRLQQQQHQQQQQQQQRCGGIGSAAAPVRQRQLHVGIATLNLSIGVSAVAAALTAAIASAHRHFFTAADANANADADADATAKPEPEADATTTAAAAAAAAAGDDAKTPAGGVVNNTARADAAGAEPPEALRALPVVRVFVYPHTRLTGVKRFAHAARLRTPPAPVTARHDDNPAAVRAGAALPRPPFAAAAAADTDTADDADPDPEADAATAEAALRRAGVLCIAVDDNEDAWVRPGTGTRVWVPVWAPGVCYDEQWRHAWELNPLPTDPLRHYQDWAHDPLNTPQLLQHLAAALCGARDSASASAASASAASAAAPSAVPAAAVPATAVPAAAAAVPDAVQRLIAEYCVDPQHQRVPICRDFDRLMAWARGGGGGSGSNADADADDLSALLFSALHCVPPVWVVDPALCTRCCERCKLWVLFRITTVRLCREGLRLRRDDFMCTACGLIEDDTVVDDADADADADTEALVGRGERNRDRNRDRDRDGQRHGEGEGEGDGGGDGAAATGSGSAAAQRSAEQRVAGHKRRRSAAAAEAVADAAEADAHGTGGPAASAAAVPHY